MTPDEQLTVCINTLSETEQALEEATNNIEKVRALLRREITHRRAEGHDWKRIKESPVWEAFRLIGGR